MIDWGEINSQTIAWFAGMVEGEGCLTGKGGAVSIDVSSSDQDTIAKVVALTWALKYQSKPGGFGIKIMHHARLHWAKAISWMLTIYSYLGSRRRSKIKNIVAQWRISPGRRGSSNKCPHGHPYDYFLILKNGEKRRYCKRCSKQNRRNWYARKKVYDN